MGGNINYLQPEFSQSKQAFCQSGPCWKAHYGVTFLYSRCVHLELTKYYDVITKDILNMSAISEYGVNMGLESEVTGVRHNLHSEQV